MSPVSWQHSARGPLYNLHTSPYIILHPQKQKLSTRSTRRKKVLSRRAWCVFMLRM
jgi:hypothetical protein